MYNKLNKYIDKYMRMGYNIRGEGSCPCVLSVIGGLMRKLGKCNSCVYAKWERDDFFNNIWYVSGCKKGVVRKDRGRCEEHECLDIDKEERLVEVVSKRVEISVEG